MLLRMCFRWVFDGCRVSVFGICVHRLLWRHTSYHVLSRPASSRLAGPGSFHLASSAGTSSVYAHADTDASRHYNVCRVLTM